MPFSAGATKLVPFHIVPDGDQWAIGEETAYLVVTEKNWSYYYSNLPRGSDFVNSIYVVVSLGVKPNPGYSVRIQQLEQMKERVTVKVELKEPDPRKAYPQIIVHPIAVAEVAKADFELRGLLEFTFIDQKGRQLATLSGQL